MPEPRFLVLRLGSLGDIVHTFPAVSALRETFPNAEIVWLTHPRWKLLVESSGLASQVWATETRSIRSLRKIIEDIRAAHWDAAIDYQGLWKSAALAFFGGIKRRIGFSSETIREFGVPILYTDRVRCTTTHIADQNGELSLRAGTRNPVAPFSLHVPQEDECGIRDYLQNLGLDRYIVLSPGGGWRSKCWPPERFGQLSQMIRDSLGLRCVVNFGPGEDDLALAARECSGDADSCTLQWSTRAINGSLAQRGVHRRRRHRPASSRDCTWYSGRRSLWSHGSCAQWPVSHRRHRFACARRNKNAQPH